MKFFCKLVINLQIDFLFIKLSITSYEKKIYNTKKVTVKTAER